MPGGQDRLIYLRKFELYKYDIPASDYNEYCRFMKEVEKTGRLQVVLLKK